MEERVSWEKYFMDIAEMVATRSTCVRRKVGAVAVDEQHRIVGTGYNGAPVGFTHCTKETCIRCIKHIPSGQMTDICRAIHAEQNLVIHLGEKLRDCTVFCTTKPCTTCTKLLIGCGVKEIVWKGNYNDDFATALLQEYADFLPLSHGEYIHVVRKNAVSQY